MKKVIITIISIVVIFLGVGAVYYFNQTENSANNTKNTTEQVPEQDVREAVWEQLSQTQQDSVEGTWEDFKVSKITLNENMMSQVDDKSYEGKEVYLIDIPISSLSVPNSRVVYADIDTYDYIGDGVVD